MIMCCRVGEDHSRAVAWRKTCFIIKQINAVMVKKNGILVGLERGKSRNFLHDLLQMNAINPSRIGFTDERNHGSLL